MAHRTIQLLVVLLAAFASVAYARAPAKILDGENASILDFPYQVYLQIHLFSVYYKLCGGTIIDAKHILTAAHCVEHESSLLPSESFKVITGTDNIYNESTEDILQVLQVIQHPDHNKTGESENDIAILKLKEAMSFNEFRKSAGLPIENISEGTEAMITGWGRRRSDYTGPVLPELQKLKVTVLNITECCLQDQWTPFSSKICTKSVERGGACPGDSGGPLSYNGTVVGVQSTAGCDHDSLVYCTRVYSYLPWIKSIIEG